MSQTLMTAKRPQLHNRLFDGNRRAAEDLLREAAFVMEMTRRVKEEIIAEQRQPAPAHC